MNRDPLEVGIGATFNAPPASPPLATPVTPGAAPARRRRWTMLDLILITGLLVSASGVLYQVLTGGFTPAPAMPAPATTGEATPCLAPALNEQTHITLFHIDGELRIRCVTVSILGKT
jgi:hypothetical protein